ncbi:MAG TPA: proton-conducting transporter membrane subunit [Solirubrobacteraceae bacterium]|jgi:hydrogenase-4 component F
MGVAAVVIVALPLAAALVSWAVGDRPIAAWASLGAGIGSLAAALVAVFAEDAAGGVRALGGIVYLDGLGGVFLLAVAFVYAVVAVYSVGYLHPGIGHVRLRRLYWPLLNLFGFALVATPLVDNLAALWVVIELTTIVSAVLVTAEGNDASLEAAWKYIVIGSAGLAVGLLGIVVLYAAGTPALGGSYDPTYTNLAGAAGALTPTLTRVAFALVVVGFGTKVGLVPMHAWLPDAHSESPSPVSAMLSGGLLAAALYAVLRLGAITAAAVGPTYVRALLLAFGALSLLLAGLFALRQSNYKRLLAYSSIEHMGIVSLGVGIGGPIAAYGAFLHVLVHAAGKTLAFFGAGELLSRYESRSVDDVRGVMRAAPFTGVMVLVAAIAVAGMPPFGIFRSELTIVTGGFASARYVFAGLLIIVANVAFVGIYRTFHRMVLSDSREDDDTARMVRAQQPLMAAAMLTSLAVLLVLGLWIPGPLNELLHSAADVIGART